MAGFFDTERYALVPYDFHSTGKERAMLSRLYNVGNESVRSIDMPLFEAAFVYASSEAEGENFPAAYLLLGKLSDIRETHKLLVRFSEGLVTVVLADREHLLLVNSFPVSSFTDSVYFIVAALKEVVFEPEHTVLHYSGTLLKDESALLDRYFRGKVEVDL